MRAVRRETCCSRFFLSFSLPIARAIFVTW
nr:MAG TPA: hypothetical protein [Bacteriophage sp.]